MRCVVFYLWACGTSGYSATDERKCCVLGHCCVLSAFPWKNIYFWEVSKYDRFVMCFKCILTALGRNLLIFLISTKSYYFKIESKYVFQSELLPSNKGCLPCPPHRTVFAGSTHIVDFFLCRIKCYHMARFFLSHSWNPCAKIDFFDVVISCSILLLPENIFVVRLSAQVWSANAVSFFSCLVMKSDLRECVSLLLFCVVIERNGVCSCMHGLLWF